MRHSYSLAEINYQRLTAAMHEDFNLVEDERSVWLREGDPPAYEPSDDEGELESDVEPVPAESPDGVAGESAEQEEVFDRVDEIL
jgi:hypothetical protein